jgi:hypothetical protein
MARLGLVSCLESEGKTVKPCGLEIKFHKEIQGPATKTNRLDNWAAKQIN